MAKPTPAKTPKRPPLDFFHTPAKPVGDEWEIELVAISWKNLDVDFLVDNKRDSSHTTDGTNGRASTIIRLKEGDHLLEASLPDSGVSKRIPLSLKKEKAAAPSGPFKFQIQKLTVPGTDDRKIIIRVLSGTKFLKEFSVDISDQVLGKKSTRSTKTGALNVTVTLNPGEEHRLLQLTLVAPGGGETLTVRAWR